MARSLTAFFGLITLSLAAVAAQGCRALTNIAAGATAIKQAAVDGGGVVAVVAAMRAHPGCAAVAEQGCRALSNVASSAATTQQTIVDADGVATRQKRSGVACACEDSEKS